MTTPDTTLIIGGGPGGASAAIYLARFCHPVTLIDAPSQVHGRTAMASHLENFLGNDTPVSGETFLGRVTKQLGNFNIERVGAKVTKVMHTNETFSVITDQGKEYQATYLIVAVGVGGNMPEIDGLDPYYDHAIFHCLTCDWYWNRDKKAIVVANDDRGITTARTIVSMHRPPSIAVIPAHQPQFSQTALEQALSEDIAVYTSPLKELVGTNGDLHEVVLEDGTRVEGEALFTKLGHVRFDTFLDEGGITLEREPEERFIKVEGHTYESSVKNLFAVGPCNEGPDQAIVAGGQGALAAMEIHRRILATKGI